jgi:hypothetical protein
MYSCTHWLRPRNSATPPAYTGALLVSQDRRHLFVNPCSNLTGVVDGGAVPLGHTVPVVGHLPRVAQVRLVIHTLNN